MVSELNKLRGYDYEPPKGLNQPLSYQTDFLNKTLL